MELSGRKVGDIDIKNVCSIFIHIKMVIMSLKGIEKDCSESAKSDALWPKRKLT